MIPHSAPRQRAASAAVDEQPHGGAPHSCGVTRQRGRAADVLAVQVAAFNIACPVGTPGHLMRDNGQVAPTIVESPAHLLGGHIAVARFQGLRGFFSIERFIKEGNSEQ